MELMKRFFLVSVVCFAALFFEFSIGSPTKEANLNAAKLSDPSHKMLRGETFHFASKTSSVSSSLQSVESSELKSSISTASVSSESNPIPKLFPLDLPSDKIRSTLAYDLNPQSTNLYDDGFILNYNSGETRIRSEEMFTYGVFSIDFKCPTHFEGLKVSFHLSSSSEAGSKPDGFSMEFLGNEPQRARTNSIVKGYVQPYTVDFGWNCSQNFHTYTMVWTPAKTMWLVDNMVMRVMEGSDEHEGRSMPPSSAMHFFASIERPHMWGAGTFDASKGPFKAEFRNFRVASLPDNVELIPPPSPRSFSPLSVLAIPRCRETIHTQGSEVTISWGEKAGCGGNPHSPSKYKYGHFSAMIQCPKGDTSGLVTSFYLSSFEGRPRNQDEVDFQFLGSDKKMVQTNFWVDGEGGNERRIPLPFDCSQKSHNYTIVWTPEAIEWFVDSKEVRKEVRSGLEKRGKGFPTKPAYLYLALWNANNPMLAGAYRGKDAPFYSKFSNVRIFSPQEAVAEFKPNEKALPIKNLAII